MVGQGVNSVNYQRLQEMDKQIAHMKFEAEECLVAGRRCTSLRWVARLLAAALLVASTAVLYFAIQSPELSNQHYPVHLHKSVYRAQVYSKLQINDTHMRLPVQQQSTSIDDEKEKVVSCYYNTPNPHEANQLIPADIHPFLCTHINVAFANVVNKEIHLDPSQYSALLQVVKLKQQNPKLKILLSIGGAGDGSGFSEMVVNHASRKIFIKCIKSILKNYTLDGIDLDWEFPALHRYLDQRGGRERQHFSQLLREIRMEYIREKRDYLLTVAVAAPETIVDISYDVDQLNMYVDYVNIMTYDFHYYTKYTPFTGLNTPLFPRPMEQLYLATLNINYTVNIYLNKGLDKSKIVVGIATYGHTFTLVNSNNPNIGSPASSYGSLGALGFVNYPDICFFLEKFKSDVHVEYDDAAKVPYLHRGQEWVSYDTPQSVMVKANYIKDNSLRGAMIYSLNADDYAGVCGGGDIIKFPLSQSVKNTLIPQY